MPGEAQRSNAPRPMTVAELRAVLDKQDGLLLACVSCPGGPDRPITGSLVVCGHLRLTTMPGCVEGCTRPEERPDAG